MLLYLFFFSSNYFQIIFVSHVQIGKGIINTSARSLLKILRFFFFFCFEFVWFKSNVRPTACVNFNYLIVNGKRRNRIGERKDLSPGEKRNVCDIDSFVTGFFPLCLVLICSRDFEKERKTFPPASAFPFPFLFLHPTLRNLLRYQNNSFFCPFFLSSHFLPREHSNSI